MKKTASFLLITLFISSVLYNGVDFYMAKLNKKEQNWVQSNENKNENDYKVIKLNATLYTFIEDSEIEQVNETVVIDNKVYHIFKKQIKDNVLNLYYLGDENQTAIDVSLKKFMDGQDNPEQSPVKKLLKSMSKDYFPTYENKLADFKLIAISKTASYRKSNANLRAGFSLLNNPPPEFI